jgi:hypothetical protein
MDRLTYQPDEARRQTGAIKEVVQRACKAVFPEPNVGFRIHDGPWYLPGPAEQVNVTVFQKTGCCRHHPVAEIQIERPKTKEGMFDYLKARAVFLEKSQQAGNTRLIGHLQRHCPFLPRIEVTLGYDIEELPGG